MSDVEQRNVWLELRQRFIDIAPEPISLRDIMKFTYSSIRSVEIAYRSETGEWLIKLDANGLPSKANYGGTCTHLIRALDLETSILKSYVSFLKAWEEGSVLAGQTERAYLTEVLLNRL